MFNHLLQKTRQPMKKVPPVVHRDHGALHVLLHLHLRQDRRPRRAPRVSIQRSTLSNKMPMIQIQMSTKVMISTKMKREILMQISVSERRKHERFSPALKYFN